MQYLVLIISHFCNLSSFSSYYGQPFSGNFFLVFLWYFYWQSIVSSALFFMSVKKNFIIIIVVCFFYFVFHSIYSLAFNHEPKVSSIVIPFKSNNCKVTKADRSLCHITAPSRTLGWSIKFALRKYQQWQIIHSYELSVLLVSVPSETLILTYYNILYLNQLIFTNINLRKFVDSICCLHRKQI